MGISTESIGDDFQKHTQYHRSQMSNEGLDWSAKPALYKTYPDCEQVALPDFHSLKMPSLLDVIDSRMSIRCFRDENISIEQLSCLLWISSGINRYEQGFEFRTAPSAGALYPIETYVVINRVQDFSQGLYHYNIRKHTLELLKKGQFGQDISRAALGQMMCADCGAVFVYSAVFQRSRWKYRQRAYRYIYLDAGHMAQNLALAATSLGLGSCQIGALFDVECNAILNLNSTEESVIYISAVGVPA